MPFRRKYRAALSGTFDAYLSILRIIDKRVLKALGRNTPNWRVLNACPPCGYEVRSVLQSGGSHTYALCKLEGEPDLTFWRMLVLDGNNSLSRMAQAGDRVIDSQNTFSESDYYLSEEFVNTFSGKPQSQALHVAPNSMPDDADSAADGNAEELGPADGAGQEEEISQCANNWKAAASDERKKMWPNFAETGIFASACRHGFILWIVDMIRSGEL